MSETIPLQATPNQTLTVPLAGQSVDLHIYQQTSGLYIDVVLNGEGIVFGVICQDRNRIIRDLYFGFPGDFVFYDTLGSGTPSDPDYTGLGGRYQLVYIEADELPPGVG